MNKVTLVGNVVKDCEMVTVGEKGTFKAYFTLACNERLGEGKEMCNFIPCVMWGKMAENLSPYITKGSKVAVNGRLDIKSVESEEYENEYKTYVSINVNELDFCGGNGEKKDKSPKKEKKERKQREKK